MYGLQYKGDRGIIRIDLPVRKTPAPPITVPRRDKEEKRKTDREGAAFRKEYYMYNCLQSIQLYLRP